MYSLLTVCIFTLIDSGLLVRLWRANIAALIALTHPVSVLTSSLRYLESIKIVFHFISSLVLYTSCDLLVCNEGWWYFERTKKRIMFPRHWHGSDMRDTSRLLEPGWCSFSRIIATKDKWLSRSAKVRGEDINTEWCETARL